MATRTRLRVAIADDEPDVLLFYKKLLEHLGHEVVAIAENGVELIDRIKSTRPDLVITDVRMPQMDGIAVAQMLSKTRPVPVVFVSAEHDEEFVKSSESQPSRYFLTKPVGAKELVPLIRRVVAEYCTTTT